MKPLVYIAGPYSSDPVAGTRRAIEVGIALWQTGRVIVLIPHLSLLSDLLVPMPCEDWYAFDLDLVDHCDAVLRLESTSTGADAEVLYAGEHGLPVFASAAEVLDWAGSYAERDADA